MKRGILLLLALVVLAAAGPPAQARTGREEWRETGRVVRILDGDTFDMAPANGRRQRVRVNGIQAPEKTWCGGKEATAALRAVLPKGTRVRLASVKASSGNAPTGVWRLRRTVHRRVGGVWQDIAPELLANGIVLPFPHLGESAHNEEYLRIALFAADQRRGVYDQNYCGDTVARRKSLRLEVLPDGPGRDVSANSEFVMVFNGSDRDISLDGWMVQDTSPLNAFFFPKGAVVRADDYVVVFSGKGRRGVAPDGRRDSRYFYSGHGHIWNNATTDIAFLFDDEGGDDTGNLREWLIVTPGG